MKIGRLTISDRASAGIYEDRGGPEIERVLRLLLQCIESLRGLCFGLRDPIRGLRPPTAIAPLGRTLHIADPGRLRLLDAPPPALLPRLPPPRGTANDPALPPLLAPRPRAGRASGFGPWPRPPWGAGRGRAAGASGRDDPGDAGRVGARCRGGRGGQFRQGHRRQGRGRSLRHAGRCRDLTPGACTAIPCERPRNAGAFFILLTHFNSESGNLSPGCEVFAVSVSYTHLRAHETVLDLVCRLLLEKKPSHTYDAHV